MMSGKRQYWRITRVLFLALAGVVVIGGGSDAIAAMCIVCSLVCHATRTILDVVEARGPTHPLNTNKENG